MAEKKILFVGAEIMPFAATGGLGDVLGSLPAAIKAELKDDGDIRAIDQMHAADKIPPVGSVEPRLGDQCTCNTVVFFFQSEILREKCGISLADIRQSVPASNAVS